MNGATITVKLAGNMETPSARARAIFAGLTNINVAKVSALVIDISSVETVGMAGAALLKGIGRTVPRGPVVTLRCRAHVASLAHLMRLGRVLTIEAV